MLLQFEIDKKPSRRGYVLCGDCPKIGKWTYDPRPDIQCRVFQEQALLPRRTVTNWWAAFPLCMFHACSWRMLTKWVRSICTTFLNSIRSMCLGDKLSEMRYGPFCLSGLQPTTIKDNVLVVIVPAFKCALQWMGGIGVSSRDDFGRMKRDATNHEQTFKCDALRLISRQLVSQSGKAWISPASTEDEERRSFSLERRFRWYDCTNEESTFICPYQGRLNKTSGHAHRCIITISYEEWFGCYGKIHYRYKLELLRVSVVFFLGCLKSETDNKERLIRWKPLSCVSRYITSCHERGNKMCFFPKYFQFLRQSWRNNCSCMAECCRKRHSRRHRFLKLDAASLATSLHQSQIESRRQIYRGNSRRFWNETCHGVIPSLLS